MWISTVALVQLSRVGQTWAVVLAMGLNDLLKLPLSFWWIRACYKSLTGKHQCTDVTKYSWHFKSVVSRPFVQHTCQTNNKENTKSSHFLPLVRGIYQGPVDSVKHGQKCGNYFHVMTSSYFMGCSIYKQEPITKSHSRCPRRPINHNPL